MKKNPDIKYAAELAGINMRDVANILGIDYYVLLAHYGKNFREAKGITLSG